MKPVDFAYWAKHATWTLHEAVVLSLNADPRTITRYDGSDRYSLRGAPSEAFEQKYMELYQLVDRARKARQLKYDPTPRAFTEWARLTAAIDLPTALVAEVDKRHGTIQSLAERCAALEAANEQLRTAVEQLKQGCWPWGSHETERLRQLADAAKRFWSEYDPEQPDTAPTNEQVCKWLKERNVPSRVAEIMAQMLRADSLRMGRRKS